jgi:hypothetical protein
MVAEQRDELLHELQVSQKQVARLLETMADVQDWQPEPAEWSFRYIAAHLASVEQKWHLLRVQSIASGERPHFPPYSNQEIDYHEDDLRESLRQWVRARRKLIDFVSRLSVRELEFTGVHEPIGDVTILDTLEEILLQDQGNLGLVRDLIVAYHKSAPQREREDTMLGGPGYDSAGYDGAGADWAHFDTRNGGEAA